MNAEISKKFAAFTVALSMTGLIVTGVAYTFDVQLEQRNAGISGQRQCVCAPGQADYCQCEATAGLL
jgi:hypothetical protein